MPRAKGGYKTRRRRKKVLEMAKGFYGARSRLFRPATEAVDKAMRYAYRDRKAKKREFRALWIVRINAACREAGLTYSQFMSGLRKSEIALDRKVLADMAYNDPQAFRALAETAREKLAA
ncbi:MAG: 50S ribosomal protein L20 [Thermodesulfovibrionales bacterium]